MKSQKPSETLRRMIRDSGLSLREIGEETGVDAGRLSRFVRGERDLTLAAVDRLCIHFGYRLQPTKTKKRKVR